MNKQKLLSVLVPGVAIVVIAVVLVVGLSKKAGPPPSSTEGQPSGEVPPVPVTREAIVDTNIAIPEKGDTNLPTDVAVPQISGAGNPQGTATFRGFVLRAENGTFTPDTFIVKEGDTVHIEFVAVDRDYDFTQPDFGFRPGNNIVIKKGESKVIEFGASASGKFTFYCDSCSDVTPRPVGTLTIVPK